MEEKNHETAGQEFIRWLRPGGCIIVLLIAILVLAVCFISGRDPVKGYEPSHSSEYFAQHLDELKSELEENVFPVMGGVVESHISGDKLVISIDTSSYVVTRAAVLKYFDKNLFEFVEIKK